MDKTREEVINKFWENIHGRYKSIFYWMNDTKTGYWYDPNTDAIVSDNGFSVPLELPTADLTQDYIYDLIEQLEGDIAEYYRENFNILL